MKRGTIQRYLNIRKALASIYKKVMYGKMIKRKENVRKKAQQ